jgi:hypothetical protein
MAPLKGFATTYLGTLDAVGGRHPSHQLNEAWISMWDDGPSEAWATHGLEE